MWSGLRAHQRTKQRIFGGIYSFYKTMMQLSASCSVLTESQRIHSGKEKLNLLLAGHLSYLEVQNPRGTKEQSGESED